MGILPEVTEPLNVVLVEPQIPPNTGNVARLCSVTGSRLHLVGPLGFSIADKDMRRAGLDYWDRLWRRYHADLGELLRSLPAAARLHLFTARAERGLWEVRFAPGDWLIFGSEPKGLPASLLAGQAERTVAIPMLPGSRSLNLATAAGIGLYEALRQIAGAVG
ncbi:MAG: tRNA (cytidine(34)-2'-O)-methyltransferase [Myxococcales bacterium]